MNIGVFGFLQGLTQGIYNRQRQIESLNSQLQAKKAIADYLVGNKGLLADLVKENPMLRDVITANVFGINIPLPKPPRVSSVHIVDSGDRITPFVVMSDGTVKIPASFYKNLSPYQRQQLKLKAQQLGLQKVKLMQDKEWKDFLKVFKVEELNTQKQKMQMDYSLKRQNLGLKSAELQLKAKQLQNSLQDENLKRIGQQVNLLMKAGNALLKKYKLDINSLMDLDEIKAHDVIGEIEKVNPADAERLRRIYARLNQLVSKGAGIRRETQIQQNSPSIPLQTKNFLKGWGIE